MGDIINYEPMLWLIPYERGIRIRDGEWIDKRVSISLPVKIVDSLDDCSGLRESGLILTAKEHQVHYVRCEPGYRMFLRIK